MLRNAFLRRLISSTGYISGMANPSVPLTDSNSLEPRPISSHRKGQRWFEVALVMSVAFSGSLATSVFVLRNGPGAVTQLSSFRMLVGLIHEVTCLFLLGYVLSRQSRRFRDIGLTWSLRDVGVGLVVAVVSLASYWLGAVALNIIHYAIFRSPVMDHSPREIFGSVGAAVIPFILLNPFFEELIVRAYLMTEIMDLTGSAMLAIATSVLLQASYHLYYGWFGALSLSFQFLIFAIYYATRRRALPLIVAHGFFDLYGLMRLW